MPPPRPADAETVDHAALPIGIPSGACTEAEEERSRNLYFIFLKPAGYSHQHRPQVPIKGLRLGHLLGAGTEAGPFVVCKLAIHSVTVGAPGSLGHLQFAC